MTQAQVQVVRSESPWVTAVLLAFSFVLMSSVLSLPAFGSYVSVPALQHAGRLDGPDAPDR